MSPSKNSKWARQRAEGVGREKLRLGAALVEKMRHFLFTPLNAVIFIEKTPPHIAVSDLIYMFHFSQKKKVRYHIDLLEPRDFPFHRHLQEIKVK